MLDRQSTPEECYQMMMEVAASAEMVQLVLRSDRSAHFVSVEDPDPVSEIRRLMYQGADPVAVCFIRGSSVRISPVPELSESEAWDRWILSVIGGAQRDRIKRGEGGPWKVDMDTPGWPPPGLFPEEDGG